MLKDRDYASVVRLLDRTKAMTADDPGGKGDPGDDIDFCNEVLTLLQGLRQAVAEEAAENDGDDTSAWAAEALPDIDDIISDVQDLLEDLRDNGADEATEPPDYSASTRPAGYIPG